MAVGKVFLVGAGPGDPGLLTVKGLAAIRSAEVLVYDRLASPALVAQARPEAEKIYVGKVVGRHGRKQADISRLLVEKALEGKVVCRLKGGDPFVYGRGGEEADLLVEHGIAFEVVPGITAGLAASAYAGIPVTHRDHAGTVALVTGHEAPDTGRLGSDWGSLLSTDTLLIYMGVESLPGTAARLISLGKGDDTPVAVIGSGTLAEQQTVTGTLADIAARAAAAGISSPAMIVVGRVVSLRSRLGWAEGRPLAGRRSLVLTAGEPNESLAAPLREMGAEVWEWPVAAVVEEPQPAHLDQLLRELPAYGTLLLAGAPAARLLPARLLRLGLDLRALAGLALGASDSETAGAMATVGLRPDLPIGLDGLDRATGPVLVLGEAAEGEALVQLLRAKGFAAEAAATHRLLPRTDLAPLLRENLSRIDEILLPSARSAGALLDLLAPDSIPCLAGVRLVASSQEAAEVVRQAGLPAELRLVAREAELAGAVER